jgi:hypothetical protein
MIKAHVSPAFGVNASQRNALCGRYPKFGNQPQNVSEEIFGNRDFGHLKCDHG